MGDAQILGDARGADLLTSTDTGLDVPAASAWSLA
jgi:hypothetical protein